MDARRALVTLLAREPGGGPPAGDAAWSGPVEVLVTALSGGEGVSPDDAGAASVLFSVALYGRLPDATAKRLLAIARARPPHEDPYDQEGYDVVLARLLAHLPVERLGLLPELREVALRYPGTRFQRTLVEYLRWPFAESRERVALLSDLLAGGDPVVARSAIRGLLPPAYGLPGETCAALGRGARRPSPEVSLLALLGIAALPCGPDSGRALDQIEARVRAGPLPVGAALAPLCASGAPAAGQVRPRAVLRSIASSRVQPVAVRKDAMSSVHFCDLAAWPSLLALLLRDPDEGVRAAADEVDHRKRHHGPR